MTSERDARIRPDQFRDLSTGAMKLIAHYGEHYEILVHHDLATAPPRPIRVGSTSSRRCRYCGATDKKSFRKVAHALPEAIGIRALVSTGECDQCNEFFGRELDQHFANYLGLKRTLWQIRGKKGVPVYAVPGRNPRLWQAGENSFVAEATVDDNFLEIDREGHAGRINAVKQPYRPLAVFKALTKSAVALLPESELPNFEQTIQWIKGEIQGAARVPHFAFTSSTEVRRLGFEALLLRRRSQNAPLPYMTFFLCFANLTLQVFLPYSRGDWHFVGQTIQVHRFPNRAERIGQVKYGHADLSSPDLVRGEVETVDFTIGEPGVLVERLSAAEKEALLAKHGQKLARKP